MVPTSFYWSTYLATPASFIGGNISQYHKTAKNKPNVLSNSTPPVIQPTIITKPPHKMTIIRCITEQYKQVIEYHT